MIIPLNKIVTDYKINIKGVIHIGAHCGQEYNAYKKQGISEMVFFEPINSNFRELVKQIPRNEHIKAFNVALGNKTGIVDMFVETANHGMSCSVLEPGTHLNKYPNITFDTMETVSMFRLDDMNLKTVYNMINIDVQGYELEVFKGAINTLECIDIIYSEINLEQVYKGCVQVEELDLFLGLYGFKRVLTDITPKTWGDALYLKR